MANAMFRALTHGATVPPAANPAIGADGAREAYPGKSVASPRTSADAAAELSAWFSQMSEMLEPPCCREDVASGILIMLQRFFPARQSELFLTNPDSEVLSVAAARGAEMSLAEAEWVERTAREALTRCDVLGRESSCASLSSFLWIPILCEGRPVGVIEMGDCSGHWFSGGQTRELSRLADDVGALLVRFDEIAVHQVKIEGLERDLSAGARECKELERRILAGGGRESVFEMATSIAERATDPVSYVLANLRSARDEVDSMQNIVGTLVETARALVEQIPGEFETPEVGELRAALASADTNNFGSFLADLAPLIEDVEEGTSRLQSVAADFRELALGETAPMGWVDLTEVIERALVVISRRSAGEHAIEVRISEIPPIRCQRLRIERLLIDTLGRALEIAAPGSSLAVQADLRGSQVVVDISVEVNATQLANFDRDLEPGSPSSQRAVECLGAEHVRLGRDIAEDHGGQFSVDAWDDQLVTQLVLPVDRD